MALLLKGSYYPPSSDGVPTPLTHIADRLQYQSVHFFGSPRSSVKPLFNFPSRLNSYDTLGVMPTLEVVELGLQPYQKVLDLQRTLFAAIKEGRSGNILILCSHPPVITIGKSGKASRIKVESSVLSEKGVDVFEVERGGDATYHGPGQIVGYPLLDLNPLRRDVGWYVRTLEEVLILTLADHNIVGTRVPGKPGVWVQGDTEAKKICSIGVKLSRWCTMHGFSLNVLNSQDGFGLIDPCGMPEVRTTSIEEETGVAIPLPEVALAITRHFLELFAFDREER